MATEIHATLFLLRRGPVAEKWDRTALGQSDPPLQRGLAPEESAVATAIAALQPSRIVSSDLRRARMTAERISEYTGAPPGGDDSVPSIDDIKAAIEQHLIR